MFEQRSEEGGDHPAVVEGPEEGLRTDALGPTDRYPSYSLDVLRLLED